MSLTLGLIVWFHEKQKKNKKQQHSHSEDGEKQQQKYGKQARKREKENENVKRNVMGKNFHSILLCAIENLQIAFCFHCSNEAYSRLL